MDIDELVAGAEDVDGARVLLAGTEAPDAEERCSRCSTASRAASATRRSCSPRPADGRVHLVASVAPSLVERGLKAGELVKVAAARGRWRGRGTRHDRPGRGTRSRASLDDALESARRAIAETLAGDEPPPAATGAVCGREER